MAAGLEEAMEAVEAQILERHDDTGAYAGLYAVAAGLGIDVDELDAVFGVRAGQCQPRTLAPDLLFDAIATCMAAAFLGGAQWQREQA